MIESEKEILINQKIKKAKSTISEVNNLISFGYHETAVNRLYYACFYCVQALLARTDIFPKSHKGVITMFNVHYVKTAVFSKELARFYHELFEQRLMADYRDAYEATKEMTESFLSNAGLFLEQTETLLKIKE